MSGSGVTTTVFSYDNTYLDKINDLGGLTRYIQYVKNVHTNINYTNNEIYIDSNVFGLNPQDDAIILKTITILNNFSDKLIQTSFTIKFNYSDVEYKYKPTSDNLVLLYKCIAQFKNITVLSIEHIKVTRNDITNLFNNCLYLLPNLNTLKILNTDLNDDIIIDIASALNQYKFSVTNLDFSGNLVTAKGLNGFLTFMNKTYTNSRNNIFDNIKELKLTDTYKRYADKDNIIVYNDDYIVELFKNIIELYKKKSDFMLAFKVKTNNPYSSNVFLNNFSKIQDVEEFINKSDGLVNDTQIDPISKYKNIKVYRYLYGVRLEYYNDTDENNIIVENIKNLFLNKPSIAIKNIITNFEPNNKLYSISVYVDIDGNMQTNTIFTDTLYLTNDIFKVQAITTSNINISNNINKPNNLILYIIITIIVTVIISLFLAFKNIFI